MDLSTSISELKGVGVETAKMLDSLGIRTSADLINNFPRRYDDYSQVLPIAKLKPGQVTIEAKISQAKGRYVRRGLHITEAIATDSSASVRLVWFNQPYRAAAIKADQAYFIAGDYGLHRGRFTINNPSVEQVSNFPINTARIIPIYHEAKGLKSFTTRKLIREVLSQTKQLPEHLPGWLLVEHKLMPFHKAVLEVHFPSSSPVLDKARRRLAFEEIFELTLAALLNKYELYKEKSLAIPFKESLAKSFVAKLPFKLTDAQRKATWRIYQDMVKTQPMNRLLEGDVGSGKTVVAAMAALMAMEEQFQVALMAPTEILARQHAETLYNLLASVGYGHHVALLIGSLKPKAKDQVQAKIRAGEVKFMIGTHALIAEKLDMHKLGLIIVDEQHRFGVEQRKKLQAKAGHMPHVLHLSATPIPRSLALTLYGELDISILDELPPGRLVVKTKLCSPNSRAGLYERLDKLLESGRQMFVVCPLIKEADFKKGLSAEAVFEKLSNHDFKHRSVALLHGRMKAADKEKVMQDFIKKKYDILVSTTVIEVGVDVPNATIMLIEGAERFGLAQLHQLRGRVGRSAHQSYCFIMLSDSRAPSQRLRALETLTDGFKLAEIDLRQRGPGAIYGTLQHGALDLRVANLSDTKLIAAARNAAQKFIEAGEDIKKYKHLAYRVKQLRAITNLN
ncbi:ATP-dependent DNA helicase RecG [Candidatus Saccharibacteria bacterium RIFCSPHIGHO2_12_FULL_47_16b]|nr:MAG: ATP-dependent DNA helicase RecG [Candidatus Saccharibacteria bacterium RIFCSPHIGHO2_12_FULL_47_16b]